MFNERDSVKEEISLNKYVGLVLDVLHNRECSKEEKKVRIDRLKECAKRVGILEKLNLRLKTIKNVSC